MTAVECAAQIAAASKKGTITEEDAGRIMAPFTETAMSAANRLVESFARLNKHESAWSFSLPGGIVARVNFSAEPERRHIEAFRKVFLAMTDAWLETQE